MNSTKQVKVDNWGIFFLQRLKQFFNRTSYCDLTLHFHDNAQLKVHRLVLNACTEYFEILEQTCEMHDDCLIMPDDMQADVVVPIVNFMYTGQLEYNYNLFERLYATAQIMKMSVLTKLLMAQRTSSPKPEVKSVVKPTRTLNNDYLDDAIEYSPRVVQNQRVKTEYVKSRVSEIKPQTYKYRPSFHTDPAKPTRYELPDELDSDDIFEPSFANISYESRQLSHKSNIKAEDFDNSNSRKYSELQRPTASKRPSTSHVEPKSKRMYLDSNHDNSDLFDSIVSSDFDNGGKADSKEESSIVYSLSESDSKTLKFRTEEGTSPRVNHAKVISEVLKQYPHILKSNKNIKVKIVTPKAVSMARTASSTFDQPKFDSKPNTEEGDVPEWTYVSKDIHDDTIAKLVSLGLHNKNGPWLCLICGTLTKALNFSSYYFYRKHLVEVHKEKPSSMTCEYCGHKSGRRNHLLHHMYARHGVKPPPNYNFPKCNRCPYIALTEGNLAKHKLVHKDTYVCSVCSGTFSTRQNLMHHMNMAGHNKMDKKQPSQCAYCTKTFHRSANLYAHYKILHKTMAENDGLLEPSDEENPYDDESISTAYDHNQDEVQIKQEADGKFQIVSNLSPQRPRKQIILNSALRKPLQITHKAQITQESLQDSHSAESGSESDNLPHIPSGSINMDQIVVLNENEIIINPEHFNSKNALYADQPNDELIIPDIMNSPFKATNQQKPPQSYGSKPRKTNPNTLASQEQVMKHVTNQSQPIQIVVSDNQQFKTIMASQPIHGVSHNSTMASVTRAISQMQNINTTQSQNIMVIQDGFAMPQQAIRSDGSNIVVVYSQPLSDSNKEYVQLTPQYSQVQIAGTQGIPLAPSHLEPGEIQSQDNILLEDDLVQETVETWHEEIGQEEIQEDIEEHETTELQETNLKSNIIMSTHPTTDVEHSKVLTDSHGYTLHHEIESHVELPHHQNVNNVITSTPTVTHEMTVIDEENLESAALYYVESQPMETEVVEELVTDDTNKNPNINDKSDQMDWNSVDTTNTCNVSKEPDKSDKTVVEETIENIEVEVQKHTHVSNDRNIETEDTNIESENVSPTNKESDAQPSILQPEENSDQNASEQKTSHDENVEQIEENTSEVATSEQITNDSEQQVTPEKNLNLEPTEQSSDREENAVLTNNKGEEMEESKSSLNEGHEDEVIEDNCSQEENSIPEDDSIDDHENSPRSEVKEKASSSVKVNGKPDPDPKISTILDDWEDNESQGGAAKDDNEEDHESKQEEEKAIAITNLVSDWDD